jgi:hypothetical protein
VALATGPNEEEELQRSKYRFTFHDASILSSPSKKIQPLQSLDEDKPSNLVEKDCGGINV